MIEDLLVFKNTIRDGGSTALWTTDTVLLAFTVWTELKRWNINIENMAEIEKAILYMFYILAFLSEQPLPFIRIFDRCTSRINMNIDISEYLTAGYQINIWIVIKDIKQIFDVWISKGSSSSRYLRASVEPWSFYHLNILHQPFVFLNPLAFIFWDSCLIVFNGFFSVQGFHLNLSARAIRRDFEIKRKVGRIRRCQDTKVAKWRKILVSPTKCRERNKSAERKRSQTVGG